MGLHKDIKDKIPEAMRSRDAVRLSVLRGLATAFTNELVSKKRKPDEELDDKDAFEVIKREAKKRKDSIEQFKDGDREDLAKKEQEELVVLEEFLPEMMSVEDIKKIAEAKKAELGIDDPAKKGMLMGAIMKELAGQADGGDVKAVVDELF